MPQHTVIERARRAITKSLTGDLDKREKRETVIRKAVSEPFTGAPGQRKTRREFLNKLPSKSKSKPIIKKRKAIPAGNLPGGVESVGDALRKRQRQLSNF